MKVGTVVKWAIFVITNKSVRIYLNIFGDSVIQSLKSGKTGKMVSFPCRGGETCGFFSWYSLSDLKHDQKRFIRIPSLNVPEMRPLGTF